MDGVFQKGEKVYIKAIVTDAPRGDRTLYRLETESEGAVVWCFPEEVTGRGEME